jgi:hypothetical protein
MNANGGMAMTEFSTASNMVAVGAIDETCGGHTMQNSRWGVATRTCVATAFAALLVAGSSVPALAQTANEIWAGCVLSTGGEEGEANTVGDLAGDLIDSGISDNDDLQVAFVVVYSLKNDNDGQPVSGGFTGPVICANPEVVSVPLETTSQTDNIPPDDDEDHDTVTISDAEEAFLLQYQFDQEPTDIEKRFCHTVDSETFCFLIKPVLD